MWYSLDDNRVYQVSEKKVFEQKAYMLFYFKDRKIFPSKNGTINRAGAPKEAQMKTGQSNGSVIGQKTLATVGSEKNGFNPVATKETQTNTNLSNRSNGHTPFATVGTKKNGFSPFAPEPTQTGTKLSNGPLNVHKYSTSNGAPEPTQKKENLVPKSVSEPGSESKIDTASKTEDHTKETDCQMKEVATALPELSSFLKVGPASMEKKASRKKTHKKANNFLKGKKVISMKISSSVLMGTTLTKRKKKKHEHNKRANDSSSSRVKIEARERVKPPVENGLKVNLANEGPSSLVKPLVENGFREISVNESQSFDKIKEYEAVKVKQPVENGCKERVNKDGAVLATTDCNGVSKLSQSKQKDLVHMLTRGLEDRSVPRWDEDVSTPSHRRETTRDLTIGYIGDDWDEEYDRGKRKKVRMSQIEFDGKNPFQNIANGRLKEKQNLSKRPRKFKKSQSGNGPFRI